LPKVLHPHITSDPAICGGSPCIIGTRFPVRSVVVYILRHGDTPEELRAVFPQLNLAAIYDALAYYYDNREDMDAEIRANSEDQARRRFNAETPVRPPSDS
jgi:uncharacterized protein (DUF433 family)